MPIAATMTLEVIGLVPGTVFRRAHAGSGYTNLVMSVDKPSMRSSSRRQSQARSWMMRIMRSDSTSQHWARMPGNSVHRKPNQLGRKERIGQKHRRPAITDPSRAAPLCKSQAIRSLATSVSRAMTEGGGAAISIGSQTSTRFPRRRNRTWPSTHREYPIPVFGPGAGRVCRDKSHFISP